MKQLLIVGLGGFLGSVARHLCNNWLKASSFPLSTFLVNGLGSFIIGVVLGYWLKTTTPSDNWRLFLATGICGGFTTFSAFAFENLTLLRNGQYSYLFINIIGSILLSLLLVWLGALLGTKWATA
ncbi:MAG: fluoride efflux transporter CrcB [Sphingobacteriales bacterium]|nr:MAG: fluoride efflux transporter CrcB [Sphingobacteriales bacterium]